MIEVVRQGNKYVVIDHVLNLNTKFTTKAQADDYALELEEKYSSNKKANK